MTEITALREYEIENRVKTRKGKFSNKLKIKLVFTSSKLKDTFASKIMSK